MASLPSQVFVDYNEFDRRRRAGYERDAIAQGRAVHQQ
jgi:hypothetical protein